MIYVADSRSKGGPKLITLPDTLIANQDIERDTRVGTFFVPTRAMKQRGHKKRARPGLIYCQMSLTRYLKTVSAMPPNTAMPAMTKRKLSSSSINTTPANAANTGTES